MFPSLLVQPETSMLSYVAVSSVVMFGVLLHQLRKIALMIVGVCIFLIPNKAGAFAGGQGTCGTGCMMNWGRPAYPSVYFAPQFINPWAFQANASYQYAMLPPWLMSYPQPYPLYRTIQSVEPSIDEATE